MKIAVMSDLHFEFHKDWGFSFISSLDSTNVDVLVLAGDIGASPVMDTALDELCKKYPQVIFVPGNHDHWSYSPKEVEKQIRQICKRNSNLHWIEQSTVTIDDIRFIGATLWFPQPSPLMNKFSYPDFQRIQGFEPWVYGQNTASIKFLDKELQCEDVFVSHFYPFRKSVHPMYEGEPINCFFYAGHEVESVLRDKRPRLVIHGHTHSSFDYKLDGMRVVCNPFGYVRQGENHEFIERKIITI